MAEPIQHTVKPASIGPTAHEELERLLQTCHERGVLRLANDVVSSNNALLQTVVSSLQSESTLNAIKNLSILLMALSRIPPDQFYRVIFAVKDGLSTFAATSTSDGADQHPPGLSGAYRMLHDEELWHALAPLAAALKSLAAGFERDIENPISDFSGKTGRPS